MKRNHHFLSQWILREWAIAGRFTLQPLDGSPAHPGTAKSTGWVRDSHRADPLTLDPDHFENSQAALENQAAVLAGGLKRGSAIGVDDSSREVLERFLLLHLFRHPSMMEYARRESAAKFVSYEQLPGIQEVKRALMAQAVSYPAMLEGDWTTRAPATVLPERWQAYRRAFAAFSWHVVRFERPSLVLGDVLVCASRLRPQRALVEREYGMDAMGLQEAERLTIALSPTMGLLLSRGDRVRRLRAEAFNRSTIGCAIQWVVYPTGWENTSPDLYADASALLSRRVQIGRRRAMGKTRVVWVT